MKRILTALVTGMLLCIIMAASVIGVYAAPAAVVNGEEVNIGSNVEYSLSIKAPKQKICGIQMIVRFDNEKLELVNVETPNMPGAAVNANKNNDGMIYMNNSVITDDGLDFTETKEFIKVNFNVKEEGEAKIEYYIQYLYDIDMIEIYDYKITYNLSADGESKVADVVPPLADVDDIFKNVDGGFDAGDFSNNPEGTGSGIKPTAPPEPVVVEDKDNGNTILYVVGGVVLAALVAVIIIAIVKKNKTK